MMLLTRLKGIKIKIKLDLEFLSLFLILKPINIQYFYKIWYNISYSK